MNEVTHSHGLATMARQLIASAWLTYLRLRRSKFLWVVLGLNSLPLLAVAVSYFAQPNPDWLDLERSHTISEGVAHLFFLNFIVYFTANIFGFYIMRQEDDDQTLHYLFLQPAPRWIHILGRMTTTLIVAGSITTISYLAFYLFMFAPRLGWSVVREELFTNGRIGVLGREILVMLLALAAYGAIAMVMGSLFRSGFYALLLLGWESALPYLPSTLKMWTVMHYLQSLMPSRPEGELFQLMSEPASPVLSLTVIAGIVTVFTGFCMIRYASRECQYTEV